MGNKAKVLVPALATGLLLWLSYFPLSCGWLGWVALVPLLCLVRTPARPWKIYLGAWLAGLVFFWASLQWMRVADYRMYATWAGLATACSAFFPAGIWFIRRLDRYTRLPLVFTVPVAWTALEFTRAHLFTGFPWYFLSHTQHAFLPMIQIADLGGAYTVTFVLAAGNALMFELLVTQGWFRVSFGLPSESSRTKPLVLLSHAAAFVVLLAGTLAYGMWRLSQNDFTAGPVVALLQGNVDQRIRNAATADQEAKEVETILRDYVELSDEAVSRQPRPALIVWPETSYPRYWADKLPEVPASEVPPGWQRATAGSRQFAEDVARRWKTNVLLGLNVVALGRNEQLVRFNSALLVSDQGKVEGRYDKIHRVPFGEYVPLRDWLPWMNKFAPYDFDYSIRAGDQQTRFALGPYHFGVLICYEDTDPYLARQYGHAEGKGPPVDFLLNISNDGWFDGTSEHEEHLAICRFRAVECRRAVARAVNMGISAVIDPNGRIIALPGASWKESKKVAAVLTATIPIDHRISLYALWGDWLPWGCWLVIGTGLLGSLVRVRHHEFSCPKPG
jgi:apolipoprotein N-acyltransferase